MKPRTYSVETTTDNQNSMQNAQDNSILIDLTADNAASKNNSQNNSLSRNTDYGNLKMFNQF